MKDSLPTPRPPFPSWGGVRSEAQRVDSRAGLVVGLALQHKEMDTKMLERTAMTLETERGKLPCF